MRLMWEALFQIAGNVSSRRYSTNGVDQLVRVWVLTSYTSTMGLDKVLWMNGFVPSSCSWIAWTTHLPSTKNLREYVWTLRFLTFWQFYSLEKVFLHHRDTGFRSSIDLGDYCLRVGPKQYHFCAKFHDEPESHQACFIFRFVVGGNKFEVKGGTIGLKYIHNFLRGFWPHTFWYLTIQQ